MSSTELVRSAAEYGDAFTETALRGIAAAAVEQKIEAHYFKRAEKLYRGVWRQCKRQTGHVFTGDYSDTKTCKHCGKPGGDNVGKRERKGISALATKLREADRAAGIEYTP